VRQASDAEDRRVPAHRRVASALRAEIEGGVFVPGSQLPAEPDLALQFGVSRGTLRQALQSLRADGLIEAVPGRGNFVAHGLPAGIERRRRVIGVIVPSVAQPYVADLLAWIEDELHERGYSMIVGNGGSTRQQQAGRIHRILDEGASGLIVYPIDYDPDPALFAHLLEREFPIVLIDRHLIGLPVDTVEPDNTGGAYAAVRHLIELGHRRICFVSTDNLRTTSVADRLRGYEEALASAGLAVDPELIFSQLPVARRWPIQAADGRQREVVALARFLERRRPTAVFTLHDYLAADVLEAAETLGLRVPTDLALASFDDDPAAAKLPVPLTAVAQPREQLGRTAARLLIERIDGRRRETARIVLPTQLIVRESSVSGVAAAAAS
jgi:GntR family transcriptional regulator, arabinose operon transcriptional repressor